MIRMEVRVSVPYAAIAAQALALREVHVRPSGPQLTVAVAFRAELAWPAPLVRGTLRVAGTPIYDAATQRLRLSDVSITGDVDHVLARAALAYKRRALVDALSGFSLDLEPVLRRLRDRSNAGLAGRDLAPNVALRGHVETMRVDEILLADELILVASASGDVRAIADLRVGD